MSNKSYVPSNDSQPVLRPSLNSLISKKFSTPLQGSLRKPLSPQHYESILNKIVTHLK